MQDIPAVGGCTRVAIATGSGAGGKSAKRGSWILSSNQTLKGSRIEREIFIRHLKTLFNIFNIKKKKKKKKKIEK